MTTLCWNCSHTYGFLDAACPECGATNPNHDFEKAQAELFGEQQIEMPALLREQAA